MCAYGCRKAETLRYFLQRPCKGQTAKGRLSGKHALHCLILIAVYCGAVLQSLRHAMGIEVVALGTVYAETHQLLLPLGTRDVAKSVAVGKGSDGVCGDEVLDGVKKALEFHCAVGQRSEVRPCMK